MEMSFEFLLPHRKSRFDLMETFSSFNLQRELLSRHDVESLDNGNSGKQAAAINLIKSDWIS
jgi:hypothetical protein